MQLKFKPEYFDVVCKKVIHFNATEYGHTSTIYVKVNEWVSSTRGVTGREKYKSRTEHAISQPVPQAHMCKRTTAFTGEKF